ncbi:hypothetical protein LTR13_007636 [Exophiala sideris]|uniref:Uncharacterized protein n=1 Tax=Exophiala sideris TaxID=1016849 RepID=A0ABR0J8P3_9EURO|nr:hypothetical protein LTR13_007636 [Exophiala sideris]KAK5058325.1 hypothetical protein LTR69_006729 [Exophiala sideris]KAK5180254.1 hypothetical protein LTR44_007379 [Eurotiomycetes sp. CCFEE 6388]
MVKSSTLDFEYEYDDCNDCINSSLNSYISQPRPRPAPGLSGGAQVGIALGVNNAVSAVIATAFLLQLETSNKSGIAYDQSRQHSVRRDKPSSGKAITPIPLLGSSPPHSALKAVWRYSRLDRTIGGTPKIRDGSSVTVTSLQPQYRYRTNMITIYLPYNPPPEHTI